MRREHKIHTQLDQCQHGVWIKSNGGVGSTTTPIKFLTNSPAVAGCLSKARGTKGTRPGERHNSLFSVSNRREREHPQGLHAVICEGLREQIELDKQGLFIIADVHAEDAGDAIREMRMINEIMINNVAIGLSESLEKGLKDGSSETKERPQSLPTATEEQDELLEQAWDDVNGAELDASEVRGARREEVEYIHKTNLYTKVPRNKAKALGAKVITVRWIDINKETQTTLIIDPG